jgi:Ca-activated chloride channel family protein
MIAEHESRTAPTARPLSSNRPLDQRPRADRRRASLAIVTALAAFCPVAIAQVPETLPQPRLRQDPHVRTGALSVHVSIVDDVATTELRQVLKNTDPQRIAEADWVLPLPEGASADAFTMTVGNETLEGEVLDAGKARQVYEEIVRRRRDPGLLEYFGRGCLRARVFPIPAGGEVEVRVRFRHLLPATGTFRSWTFPIRGLSLPGGTPERFALDVAIRAERGLRNVFSPTDGMDVVQKNDREARVSLEMSGGNLPQRDPLVVYGRPEQGFGLDILAHRAPDASDGHFLLMLQPGLEPDAERPAANKLVQFVLDVSGSMQGEKIEQARRALATFVRNLKPGDRFDIITFSTEAQPFFGSPRVADEANKKDALERIEKITARGGTNIHDALDMALRARAPEAEGSVPVVVFLTDGLPTIGTTAPENILAGVRAAQDAADDGLGKRRVFVFGVGHDVDTKLLDTIALESGGERDYVAPEADIELATSALLDKIGAPVLYDCELAIEGLATKDMHPRRIPDLFRGSQVTIAGQYTPDPEGKPVVVRLRGRDRDGKREYVFEPRVRRGEDAAHEFVRTIWAQRRIGFLLDEIRLKGRNDELVAEVERLGREYGVVTPFTSHLIVEESMRIADARGIRVLHAGRGGGGWDADAEVADSVSEEFFTGGPATGAPSSQQGPAGGVASEARKARLRLETITQRDAPRSGEAAVQGSLELRRMREAGNAGDDGGRQSAASIVRRVAGRTFHLVSGVWIDKAYTAAMHGKERKVIAFSEPWFELLRTHADLAPALALGDRVVVVVGGEAIEVVPAE